VDDAEAIKVLAWVRDILKAVWENPTLADQALKKLAERKEVVLDAFYTAVRPEFREKVGGILKAVELGISKEA